MANPIVSAVTIFSCADFSISQKTVTEVGVLQAADGSPTDRVTVEPMLRLTTTKPINYTDDGLCCLVGKSSGAPLQRYGAAFVKRKSNGEAEVLAFSAGNSFQAITLDVQDDKIVPFVLFMLLVAWGAARLPFR